MDESAWWLDDAPRVFAYPAEKLRFQAKLTSPLYEMTSARDRDWALMHLHRKFTERLRDFLFGIYGMEKRNGRYLLLTFVPDWTTFSEIDAQFCARLTINPKYIDGRERRVRELERKIG